MFHLLRKPCLPVLCALFLGVGQSTLVRAGDDAPPAPKSKVMRVAAVQPKNRTIDFRLKPREALAAVELSLNELEKLVHKAGV